MDSEAILRTTQIVRSPRLAEDDEDELNAERRRLAAHAWRLFTTRKKIRLELGRTFIRIKATFPHGGWESYFNETFGETHVSLRSIQRWMKLAAEDAASSRNDAMSLSTPATDADAVNVRNATSRAEAELGTQSLGTPKPEPVQFEGLRIYRLPLHLTGDQRDRTDELRRLPKWPLVEQKVIDLLDQLHIELGIVKVDGLEGRNANDDGRQDEHKNDLD